MALIDIIKAKKKVEHWKRPILKWIRSAKFHSANLFNRNMQFLRLNVFFGLSESEKDGF